MSAADTSGSTRAKRSAAKKLIVASGASVTKMTRTPMNGPVDGEHEQEDERDRGDPPPVAAHEPRAPAEGLAAAEALEGGRPAGRSAQSTAFFTA